MNTKKPANDMAAIQTLTQTLFLKVYEQNGMTWKMTCN